MKTKDKLYQSFNTLIKLLILNNKLNINYKWLNFIILLKRKKLLVITVPIFLSIINSLNTIRLQVLFAQLKKHLI